MLAVCVASPFAFVAAMRVQSEMPEDTLFGRALKESGFATPLVILGFAALWVFPVLTAVVGGDLFSAEDRYGTWATALTRSRTRAEVFAGKVVTALGFSTVAILVLAASSVLAGILVVGRQPLVDLSGALLEPAACARQRRTRLDLGAAAGVWIYRARRADLGGDPQQRRRNRATGGRGTGDAALCLRGRRRDSPPAAHRLGVQRVAWAAERPSVLSAADRRLGRAAASTSSGCLALAYRILRTRDVGR